MQQVSKERDSVLECSSPLELSARLWTCESAGGPAGALQHLSRGFHPLVRLCLHRYG